MFEVTFAVVNKGVKLALRDTSTVKEVAFGFAVQDNGNEVLCAVAALVGLDKVTLDNPKNK